MSSRDRRPRNRATTFERGGKENEMHKLIRDLTEFENFKATILPALRKDVQAGMKPKELREKYAALVQARVITAALVEPDNSKAANAAKDIIDRVEGKATERKEVTHKFKDMSDQELDAILKSEEAELEDMQNRFEQ